MQLFRNFSLVSLGIRPRSRRDAERIRQGEGRFSRPPKTRSNEAIWQRIPVTRIAYWDRDEKKVLTESPKKNDHTYVDVASMSGALVSGADENMPYRVVDDRWVVFLSFIWSQVVHVNTTVCLKTRNKIPHTPDDTEETRPERCSVYRRSGKGYRAAHLIFTTALHST